ncbi:MAG: ribbon-helix-helix domain-containing protein [Terrimicrobiaceae bacterium]
MSESEKVKKFSISMEPDLMKWVDQKVEDLNKKDRRLKSSRSAVISDAVEQAKAKEEEQGKVQSGVGAVISPVSETLSSGHSILTRKSSRKAG